MRETLRKALTTCQAQIKTFIQKYIRPILTAAILVPIIAALIKILPDYIKFDKKPPQFRLIKGISYHPDSAIVIEPLNKSANKNKPLMFSYDDFVFPDSLIPLKTKFGIQWALPLKRLIKETTLLLDGEHTIALCFYGEEKISPTYKIRIDSKSPEVDISMKTVDKNKSLQGKIVEDSKISIQMRFEHPQIPKLYQLPFDEFFDQATGKRIYSFKYNIHNIPEISKSDPDYTKPFFSLLVKDGAGNEYIYKTTYNVFIAEGTQQFGSDIAQIELRQIKEAEVPIRLDNPANPELGPPQDEKETTSMLLLQVVVRTQYYIDLQWTRLPQSKRPTQESFTLFKDGKERAVIFADTKYRDEDIHVDSTYQYQISAKDLDGKTYFSNNEYSFPEDKDKPPKGDFGSPIIVVKSLEELEKTLSQNLGYFQKEKIYHTFVDSLLHGKAFKKDRLNAKRIFNKSIVYQKRRDEYIEYTSGNPILWLRFCVSVLFPYSVESLSNIFVLIIYSFYIFGIIFVFFIVWYLNPRSTPIIRSRLLFTLVLILFYFLPLIIIGIMTFLGVFVHIILLMYCLGFSLIMLYSCFKILSDYYINYISEKLKEKVLLRKTFAEARYNPYIVGQPVYEENLFIHMKPTIDSILRGIHSNSYLIIGERRIGKTSFLQLMKKKIEKLNEVEVDYLFIPFFLNLQRATEEKLFHFFARELLKDVEKYFTVPFDLIFYENNLDYSSQDLEFDLQDIIRHLSKNNSRQIRLIFIVDELDIMNGYSDHIKSSFRSLFTDENSENLKVIASATRIKELTSEGSPWSNFFIEEEMRPFTEKEAQRLIEEPVHGLFTYTKEAIVKIISYTEKKPNNIQDFCRKLVDRAWDRGRNIITIDDVEAIHKIKKF